ncbi:hypothetical protein [Nonomuraea sp. CA-141351]|uniref:hypothetical protein n=1 Tax=Nonomuraea sp. CA-141351 TaxID=3239996 RepID=UPI003D8DB6F1
MLAYGLSSLLAVALLAVPGDGDGAEVKAQPWGYLITGRQGPRPGAANRSGSGSNVTCKYTPWHVDGQQNGGLEFVDPASNPNSKPRGDGAYYLIECSDGYRDVLWVQGDIGQTVTSEQLARQAYALIPIAPPKVLTAPPRGSDALVGLPHWFYLRKGEWKAKSKRLEVGAVWAEATATPQKMTVDAGDGKTITCDGPGTAYDPSKRADQQRSSCSYRYLHPKGAYQASVTVTWNGTWRGSGGSGGTLPSITRTVTFPIRVSEAQALVTKG